MRRSEREILFEFQKLRPMLLGEIFDVLSKALSIFDSVHLTSSPRMADFARWGAAITQAMGHPPESFDSAYSKSLDLQTAEVIHGNAVASAISSLMENKATWNGPASELLEELCRQAEKAHLDTKADYWPKAPHSLSRRLNEIIPNLAAAGIKIKRTRSRSGTDIEITNESEECSLPF